MEKLVQNLNSKILNGLMLTAIMSLVAGSALTQSNPMDEVNVVYVDSVRAGPGQDVPIGFHIKNALPLSALTIPIKFNPDLLTIKSISFSGSVAEAWGAKLVTPSDLSLADSTLLIGFVKLLFEDPIPAGRGLAFTVIFTVSDTVTSFVVTEIDTLFYPPGGYLLFADDATSAQIEPAFVKGKIFIDASNEAPSIKPLPDQYVFEGEELLLNVQASDPNGDKIRLVSTDRPRGAKFTDNGDGTGRFFWTPPYVGPGSYDGKTIKVSFWASDGDLSHRQEVLVNVLNKNRPPVLSVIDSVEITAGDSLILTVNTFEPDFEPISWEITGLPASADFDKTEPTRFIWPSTVLDAGIHQLLLVASDPHGASDSAHVTVNVLAVDVYTLAIDTVSAFPNADVEIGLSLDNKLQISSFNLLINYDPTVLQLTGVLNTGTRAAGFDSFEFTDNENGSPGHLRILGTVDTSGTGFALPIGSGRIVRLQFHIVNNITIGGNSTPLRYIFVDSTNYDDNTFTDLAGVKIEQAEIIYHDSYVYVLEVGSIVVGDINLNGIPFEIGDAIYFSNFFMNPIDFPFNAIQYANSDINGDGIAATVADLIALINVVVGGGGPTKPVIERDLVASVFSYVAGAGVNLVYETNFEVGGIFVTFESDRRVAPERIRSPFTDLNLFTNQDSALTRFLLFSLEGASMPAGTQDFIEIGGIDLLSILKIDLATSSGQLVPVKITDKDAGLPQSFALHQNYPNPFNPETNISFDLTASGRVQLEVYNVLGRKVTMLIDEVLSAGNHTVVWDGRDEQSRAVASGIYFYRLTDGDQSLTRKMMLLK